MQRHPNASQLTASEAKDYLILHGGHQIHFLNRLPLWKLQIMCRDGVSYRGKVRQDTADLTPDTPDPATVPDGPTPVPAAVTDAIEAIVGLRHKTFDDVWAWVAADVPVYLYGPAGSGKTHLARQLAAMLAHSLGLDSLPHHAQSLYPDATAHVILGIPAYGGAPYIETPAQRIWRNGGILLLDEGDKAPLVVVALNAGLDAGSGDHLTFENGETIKRHPHCRIVLAGNTCGDDGGTDHYTTSQVMDAATVNRFVRIAWNYDEQLELAVAGPHARVWCRRVQAIRAAVVKLGPSAPPRLLVTPRATFLGAKMLAQNPRADFGKLERQLIFAGVSDDDITKVLRAL